MIDIKYIRQKYDRLVLWGDIKNEILKYKKYLHSDDYIIDTDPSKQQKKFMA